MNIDLMADISTSTIAEVAASYSVDTLLVATVEDASEQEQATADTTRAGTDDPGFAGGRTAGSDEGYNSKVDLEAAE